MYLLTHVADQRHIVAATVPKAIEFYNEFFSGGRKLLPGALYYQTGGRSIRGRPYKGVVCRRISPDNIPPDAYVIQG